MSLKAQAKDLFVYLIIAVPLVAGFVVYLFLVPPNERPDVQVRWFGLAGATAVTFGYPVSWYRRLWSKPRFWTVFALLLLGHLVAYIIILLRVESWPLILFALITPAEWLLVCPLLEYTAREGRGAATF